LCLVLEAADDVYTVVEGRPPTAIAPPEGCCIFFKSPKLAVKRKRA
jgi:hypothetical protein